MITIENILVAEIIEPGMIVINKGLDDKITMDMEFMVFDEGKMIKDPSTNQDLGLLEKPKGKFKPMHIQDKMTVLISKNKRPSKLYYAMLSPLNPVDIEFDLLNNIKVGDKVKITNLKEIF